MSNRTYQCRRSSICRAFLPAEQMHKNDNSRWVCNLGECPRDSADRDLVLQNIALAKGKQRLQDINRIERKGFREASRLENAITAYSQAISEKLEQFSERLFHFDVRTGHLDNSKPVLLAHLSDIHGNELTDLRSNKYDFEVMAKRLKLFASEARKYGQALGAEKIVICFGGDLINSDRRMDELLSQATNRACASVLCVHLFAQFIADLRQDFFIDIFSVTGNEGRAKTEQAWSRQAVTDNYDFTIVKMLEKLFTFNKVDRGLRFHPAQGNETYFQIHNQLFVLIHGHQLDCGSQKDVQAFIGAKAAQGIRVTHVLAGHIHCTLLSDWVSRNSSMAGSNAYSEEKLKFVSKAAQNLHIITGKRLNGLKVDLQNVEGIEGYDVINELTAYNAQSIGRLYRAEHPAVPIVVAV
jgi:hypothetical protein